MLSFGQYHLDESSIIKKVVNFFRKKLATLFKSLGFGQKQTIKLGVAMSEATAVKGGNGWVAEYVCAYNLAVKLKTAGLQVNSDINKLKGMMDEKVKMFKDHGLTDDEIKRASNQGEAIAEDMYQSIIKNGKDLIFTDYEFKTGQHSYDIIPSGADTSKDTADDLELVVHKLDESAVQKRILVSLKAYKSSNTSLGSNSASAALGQLFFGVKKIDKKTEAEFVKIFGTLGKDFLNAIEMYKSDAREYIASPRGKGLRDYYSKKGKKASASGNTLRKKEIGDAFEKKRGFKQEHRLAQLFVDLYTKGKAEVKNRGKEREFRNAMMRILGVDDSVVTYNAIANKQGVVSEVVNSNVSDGYRRLYAAIADNADVILKSKPKSGGIDVEVNYKGTKLNGLTLNMWKDGTFQFKFDSKK